jgi:hypothetical protein
MGARAGGCVVGGEPKQASDGAGPNHSRVSRAKLLAGASAFVLAALGFLGLGGLGLKGRRRATPS